jgi:hypothetical protein
LQLNLGVRHPRSSLSRGVVAKFTVKMRDVTIGWSDLEARDRGMGAASGEFRRGPGYELVQPVFRLFAEAHGEAPGHQVDQAKLARYYAARDRLRLSLHADDGTAVPIEFVHIVDYTVEHGAEALEIQVAAASPAAWKAIEGYGATSPDA